MNRVLLGGFLAVAVVASASAAWFGWGREEEPTAPVTPAAVAPAEVMSEGPVQLPEVQAELPEGHPLKLQPTDRVLGNADAPITIIEYASLTCSHCAEFHEKAVARIKAEWVDAGKAKYVLRHMPWDNLALGMAKVAYCAEPAMYYPLVDAMFKAQKQIVTGVDTLGEIKKVARLGGVDGEQVESCVKDGPLHAQLNGMKDVAQKELKVNGTPTTFINGIRVDGGVPYEDVEKVLKQAEVAVKAAEAATAAQKAE